MSTERTTTSTMRDLIMSAMVALVLITVANAVVSTTAHLVGALQVGTVEAPAVEAPAVEAPAVDCTPVQGALFNPCATLDVAQVDDLRGSTEGRCMNAHGVQLQDGRCVAGALVWTDEISPGELAWLQREGFTYMIGADSPDGAEALLVPAEWLILGGVGGEDLLAMDSGRELTAMIV